MFYNVNTKKPDMSKTFVRLKINIIRDSRIANK